MCITKVEAGMFKDRDASCSTQEFCNVMAAQVAPNNIEKESPQCTVFVVSWLHCPYIEFSACFKQAFELVLCFMLGNFLPPSSSLLMFSFTIKLLYAFICCRNHKTFLFGGRDDGMRALGEHIFLWSRSPRQSKIEIGTTAVLKQMKKEKKNLSKNVYLKAGREEVGGTHVCG